MKTRIALVLFLLCSLAISLYSQWTTYPFEKDSSGHPQSVSQIEMDSLGKIYCGVRAGDRILIYDKENDTWKRVNVTLPVGITIDKNNNLWIASIGDGLIMYNGSDTVSYSHLLAPYFPWWTPGDMQFQANLSCDDYNNIWFGYGKYLFKLKNGNLKGYDMNELGISKLFIQETIYFYKNRLLFTGMNGYSLIFLDPDKPGEVKEIRLTDTLEYPDKPRIEEIRLAGDKIFCRVSYGGESSPVRKRSIFKLNGETFDSVAFDYLDEYNLYSIQDFIFDEKGNTFLFASIFENSNWHGELVHYKDWKKQVSYLTPDLDVPGQPEKSNLSFTSFIFRDKTDLWFGCLTIGIIKFSMNPNSISEVSISHENNLIYNPVTECIEIKGFENYRTVEIYSGIGKLSSVAINNNSINISSFPSGMYFVKLGNNIEKIIK